MSGPGNIGRELVTEAHQALRQAHRYLLDPTPQSIDCSRAAFTLAVNRLAELRRLLPESPESGRGLLPAITGLHNELHMVSALLERAAWHRSNLLRRMLQAAAA